MSALGIPVDVEVANINSILNSVLLCIFLTGMYTVLYFGTIYMYLTKHSSKYRPVSATITLLFLSILVQTAFQWYITKWQFVNNGATRDSLYVSILQIPPWMRIFLNTSNFVIYVIADGLLIWRCFYVWNRSWRIISLPLFLLIAEIGLFLFETVIDARYINGTISLALAAKLNAVAAAAFFLSFATTLSATLLIAYRIHTVSSASARAVGGGGGGRGGGRREFRHVVDIVVQSGAAYALAQLAGAVSLVVPGANTLTSTRAFALQNYTLLVNFPIAGIASTVMVARVALLAADSTYPSTAVRVSALEFRPQSTDPTVTMEVGEGSSRSVDGDKMSPMGEGEAKEEKMR